MEQGPKKSPFISRDQRPELQQHLERLEPLAPGATPAEIRTQSAIALGLGRLEPVDLIEARLADDDLATAWLANPEVAWTEVDEGSVLLHIGSATYYSLNSTATCLWAMLEQHPTFEDLKSAAGERFSMPAEDLHDDLAAFFGALASEQLIVDRDAADAGPREIDPELEQQLAFQTRSADAEVEYQKPLVAKNGSLLELTAKSGDKGKESKDFFF